MFYVSLDTPEKNAKFAASMSISKSESMDANLSVVSDPKGEVAKRFGVLGLGGLYAKRWTFYIDAEGILRAIDKKVNPATAGTDIVELLGELGFPKRKPAAKPES